MQDSKNSDYLNIIIEMAQTKKEQLEDAIQSQAQENSTRAGKLMLMIQQYGMSGCVILIAFCLLIKKCFGPSNWLGILALIDLLLLYILGQTFVFLNLWHDRIKIKNFFTSPFSSLFKTTINVSSRNSNLCLKKLMKLSDQSLEIGLIEFKNEYSKINKNYLLINPISFIVAFITIITQFTTIFKLEIQAHWSNLIMIICVGLIVWSTIMLRHSGHWAHAIALTELALKKKQALQKNFERASSISSSCR